MNRTTLLSAMVALAGLATPTDARPVSARLVALTGAQAPGAAATFDVFTIPQNPMLIRPSIDSSGRVAIHVGVRDTATSQTGIFGVWAEDAGSLRLVGLQDAFAPGCNGLTFGGFPNPGNPMPPSISEGRAAFLATLAGPGVMPANDRAIFAEVSGWPVMIAREGDTAAGPGGSPGFLLELGAPSINALGHAVFPARGFDPATCLDLPSLWSNRDGASAPIVFAGDAAPGMGAGVRFAQAAMWGGASPFDAAVFNDASELAFTARIEGPGVTGANDEGIWAERGGTLTRLARENDPIHQLGVGAAIGHGGDANFGNLGFNAQGVVIYTADLRAASGAPMPGALIADWGWGQQLFAHQGSMVFGMPGARFDRVLSAALNENAEFAMIATLTGAGAPSAAVLYANICSQQPMARAGQNVPGAPGVTIDHGQPFTWLAFNNGARAAFTADLRDANGPAGVGLFLATPDGAVNTVARTGAAFDATSTGVLRTIASIVPGALSNSGKVAFRLDFTDGSSGFYTAGVGSLLAGDANGDGIVNFADLNIVLWQFGQSGAGMLGDLNADGLVNFADLNIVLANFGATA